MIKIFRGTRVPLKTTIDKDLAEILLVVREKERIPFSRMVEFALLQFISRVIDDIEMEGEIANNDNIARYMRRFYDKGYSEALKSFRFD